MDMLELVDRLCAVAEAQARIIREQAFFIENCLAVDAEVRNKFAVLREPVEAELGEIERQLRPGSSEECGKEL